MNKLSKLCMALVAVLVVSVVTCFAQPVMPTTADVESRFGKLLRNTKVTSIKPAPIAGLYEVTAGPNVFYYAPAGDGHLVIGQILNKDGKNLTAEVQGKLRAEFQKVQEQRAQAILKNIPLDKAVKIGNGPNTIIEFTDPDCPYCRKVDDVLSKRADLTRYVFLNPLDQLHPNARAKSLFILSSQNKEKAFRDVFGGKYDKGGLPISAADLVKYPNETKQLAEGIKIGQDLGVQGTPMLFVNGKVVNGADINKITQLLSK